MYDLKIYLFNFVTFDLWHKTANFGHFLLYIILALDI